MIHLNLVVTGYIFLGLLSLSIGSFLNVIIYRLPRMIESDWKSQCRHWLQLSAPEEPSFNLWLPRSFCPHCNTKIPFWHNVPIISYALLRGRCHHCRQAISFWYPSVEIVCFGLSLLTVWFFGFNITGASALLFIWFIIPICVIDLQHQLLPDSLTLGLLWIGLLINTEGLFITLPNAVFSAAGSYLGIWLFIHLFYSITGKFGMGRGDFKLLAALGAWFGWAQVLLILLIASLTGAIIGSVYLRYTRQSRNTPIPFGPFLGAAGTIALFIGPQLIRWYWVYT